MIRPIRNNVVIEQHMEGDYIQLKSGMKLYGDASYKPENFQQERVKVVAIPDKIGRKYGIDHDEEHIIRPGDEIIVFMQELMMTEAMGLVYRENGRKYKIIDYSSIVCVLKGEYVIPVNNNIIIKPISEKVDSGVIDMPYVKCKNKGVVLYVGKQCWNYDEKHKEEVSKSFPDVRPGDIVEARMPEIPHVEHSYRLTISEEPLLVLRRYQIKSVKRNNVTKWEGHHVVDAKA